MASISSAAGCSRGDESPPATANVPALAFGQQPLGRAVRQSLGADQWGTRMASPCTVKPGPGSLIRRRQEFQPEPVAFEHIDERIIESLAVGQHCRHELSRDSSA
jgi:hypothetical protein